MLVIRAKSNMLNTSTRTKFIQNTFFPFSRFCIFNIYMLATIKIKIINKQFSLFVGDDRTNIP